MSNKKMYRSTYTFEGKRYQVYSSISKADADAKAIVDKAQREAGSKIMDKGTSVAKFASEWLEVYKKPTVEKATYSSYKNYVNNYIIPAIGGIPMQKVKKNNLQRILNEQAGKSKNHSVKLRLTMQQIFTQAVEDGVIIKSPAENLDIAAQTTTGTHRSITLEERKAILQVAETHRSGLWVLFMLYCGLRPQEAAALKYTDIDMINHRLTINRAIGADSAIKTTKSKAGMRTVPIPNILYKKIHIPDDMDQYIFLTTAGNHYTRTAMRRAWESFIRQVDIVLGAETVRINGNTCIVKSVLAPDLVPYCLRHTYCTDLEAAGVPINVASKLMGHSNIQLTAKIYSHMRNDIMDDAAEKIEKNLENFKNAQDCTISNTLDNTSTNTYNTIFRSISADMSKKDKKSKSS